MSRRIFLTTLFFSLLVPLFAGHRAGGSYSWRCIGPNTYEIKFTAITDCAHAPDTKTKYCLRGSLPGDPNNGTYNAVLTTQTNSITAHPVNFCPSIPDCQAGGDYNWVSEVVFIDTIVLAAPLSPKYTIEFCDGGNRPVGDNYGNPGAFYVSATFDITAPCNSSAYATTFHDVFFCLNDTGCIMNNIVDPDGDQLVFSLGNCYDSQGTPIGYTAPYSASNPLNSTMGWQIDNAGNICFRPTIAMKGPVCLNIQEWRGGVLIATSTLDMFINVIDCNYAFNAPTTTVAASNVSCFGGSNGSATVTPTGAVGPFTYSWTPYGGTAATATNLSAGVFTVTVKSSSGCSGTATVAITQPAPITATLSGTNVTCNGSANGSATVTPSGGNGGYTYLWSPSGGTSSIASNLPPGGYTVTVKDSKNCQTSASITITQPPVLTATITATSNVSCNGGNNGSATAAASGGTSPYSYSWNSIPVQTTATANNLPAGTYTITITDSKGCIITKTATITQPNALSFTTAQTNVSCFNGSNGSATVTVSGGTPGYTYNWIPSGGTAANAGGLTAGTYTVNVTDSKGCSSATSISITQPAAITVSVSSSSISCFGGSNGTATVSATGGIPGYTYAWSPSGGSSNIATNLSTGTYTVIVTDSKGCQKAANVTLSQPLAISATVTSTNVSCNGGSNGSATVTSSGGTGSYSYLWSPGGSTSATTSGLNVGTYTVTITDANGCIGTKSVTITQPTSLNVVVSATNVACNGGNNGAASVSASGGTGPYTYSWSTTPVQSNATATGLAAGNYTVIVTDSKGCTATGIASLTEPSVLSASISSFSHVSCNGGNNGTATVNAGGGTPGYTYNWMPSGGTSPVASNLPAGAYTVNVADSKGCGTLTTVTITQPPALTATVGVTNVPCNGGANGSATVTATGGTPGYAYTWSPSGGSSSVATGLSAGNYSVTVNDNKGCQLIVPATLSQPAGMTLTTATVNASCGLANGQASVSVTGGIAPYTYSWNSAPVQTNSTAAGLAAGSYVVTVTDVSGCTKNATVIVNNISGPSVSFASVTNISCYGGNNGSASISVTGGTPAYSYNWMPTGGSTPTASGLQAGSYTVTVTDANGCIATGITTLSEPGALNLITSHTDVACNGGNNGTAIVNASGGIPGYNYNWSPSGGAAPTANNLTAANYTVSVTDSKGCVGTAAVTIAQPSPLSVTTSLTSSVSCNGGNNGSASAIVSGGTAGYTYTWSPAGGNSNSATGLSSGIYTVAVTDSKGCQKSATINVTQASAMSISITSTNVLCFGGNTGVATATAANGTGPYSYFWTPAGVSGATATGLSAGNYTVYTTDANSCQASATVTLTQPPPIIVTTTISNAVCAGANNGWATASVSGGTGPYSYSWSTNPVQTGSTALGLSAGTYIVTVTDAKGCTAGATATVNQPTALVLFTSSSNVSCNGGNNGTAAVNVTGGTPGYSYNWSPGGGTSPTATGLSAGIYTVTVADIQNCISSATVSITQPSALTTSITASNNVACNGGNNGSATVSATGGTPGYSYSWAPSGGSSSTASGLSTGVYSVTVTDTKGCTSVNSVSITQPAPLTASVVSVTPVSCSGGNNGSATITATGGMGPYTYVWSPYGGTSATANNLSAGTFTVSITDACGCNYPLPVVINQPVQLTVSMAGNNVSCYGGNNGSSTVTASGGNAPFSYSWGTNPVQSNSTATGLSAGTYTVLVTDSKGCTAVGSVNIAEPSDLSITSTKVNNSCNGGNNGSASVNVFGGTPGYSYNWIPMGGNSATASGLGAGAYTIIVTDAAGCIKSHTLSITQPSQLTASAVVNSQVLCNGGNNGSATINPSGGTPGYTYSWAPAGGGSATANNLSSGIYSVTTTDAKGCTVTNTLTITQPPALSIVLSTVNVSCNGGTNGSASVNVSGGIPSYSYQWQPAGGNTSNATSLTAGPYSVIVSDNNGCSITGAVTITEPPVLGLSLITSSNLTCFNSCNGSAQVAASGGTAPYSYLWSPGGQASSAVNNLCAGTHTVTVTDAKGCIKTLPVVIIQPAAITTTNTITNINCYNVCDGSATIVTSGGVGPYSFQWNPGFQTTPSVNNLCAGVYTVTITDASGCFTSVQVPITQPTAVTLTTSVINTNCGSNNGSACVSVSGGMPPFTYQWNDPISQTTSCASNLSANSYMITVTDANNCTYQAAANVNNISGPNVTITASSHVTCANANNGTATAAITGGIPPYTILWSPSGQTSSFATGLENGIHTITVTDSAGCITSASVIITQPAALGAAITNFSNVSCNGGCNGSAVVAAGGGTLPYTFLWNDLGIQTTNSASGLCAGVYSVTITDANGCTTTSGIQITQPAPISVITLSVTNVSCNGGNNGAIQTSVAGGTPGYTYSWASTGGSGPNATGLIAGTYTITVTDVKGCVVTAMYSITQPAPLSASITYTNVTCNGDNDGAATVSATGGVAGYNYSWTGYSSTNSSISSLSPGIYIVTVTDANSCSIKDTAVIIEPPPLILSTSSTIVSCFGGNDGSASASVSGGNPGYTYSWQTIPIQTTSTINNLPEGHYTVTVTDANGCSETEEADVLENNAINITTASSGVSCNGGNNGSVAASVFGGTPGYTYQWVPGMATSSTVNGLTPGTYYVTVTDAYGCTSTDSAIVSQPPLLTASVAVTNSVSCYGGNNGALSAGAAGGTPGYFYVWSPAGGTGAIASNLPAGTYTLLVIDSKNCQDTVIANVVQPPPVLIASTQTNVSCFGGNNGSAAAQVTGGAPPYTYTWTPVGGNSSSATGLSAAGYTVTAMDNNGCLQSMALAITQPQVFTTNISANTNLSCFGSCNGTALAVSSGGTAPYTYTWSPGNQTSANVNNLCASTYTVLAADNNGCLSNTSITITQPSAITNLVTSTNASCSGNCNASITVVSTGGVGPYSFQWLPGGQTGPFISGLCTGTYTVVVTDNNNCVQSSIVPIIQPTAITCNFGTVTATCGSANGSATASPSGGTPPYSYQWNDPQMQTTVTATNLAAGAYVLVITDLNGCTYTDTVLVPGTTTPVITSVTGTSPICYGSSNGTASVSVGGGIGPYQYQWNDPFLQTNSMATGLGPGIFVVIVTDNYSCTATDSITLTQPSQIQANINANDTSLCYGQSVQLFCSAVGGSPAHTFYWSTGYIGTGPVTYSPTNATIYNVYAVDALGCQSQPAYITITVTAPLAVTAANVSACAGQTSTITAVASGGTGGPYTYTWGNGYMGSSQPVTLNTNQSPALYPVTVSDGCSALAFDTVIVTVNPVATGNIAISDTSGCEPLTVQFNGTSDIGTVYSWDFGDSSPPANGATINHTYYASGSYSVTLVMSTAAGCQTIVKDTSGVTVYPAPQASFSVSPSVTPIPDNTTASFTNLSTGASSYVWNFGDGTGSYDVNPEHHYNLTGDYAISLIAVSSIGCSDTFTVKTTSENYIHFANAFTPNQNGSNGGHANYSDLSNDVFFPTWSGVTEYHLMIFNKWGEMLFESWDVKVGWDGYFKGKLCEQDVYVWKAYATFKDGSKFLDAGDVTLLR